MLRNILLVILFSVFTYTSVWADGIVRGTISDQSTGELLIGVGVSLELADGTLSKYSTASDIEGNYELKAPAGTYTVSFQYISYKPKKIVNVKIEEGKTLVLNSILESEAITFDKEVIVEAEVEKETNTAVLLQQKNMPNISDNVSQDMIRKSPDRDAGEVMKRMPGVALVDNRFVVVRGLSDRYNNLTLNGFTLPSTEPDRKAFSMDIFPAGLISSMVVSKAATAEMNGEFAGALIQVNTKDFPEKFAANINYSAGYNDRTTFKPFYAQAKGNTDFLGYDRSFRALPDNIPNSTDVKQYIFSNSNSENKNNLLNFGQKFDNTWTPTQGNGHINQSMAATVQDRFKVANREVGLTFGLNYRNNESQLSHQRQLYEDTTRQFMYSEKEYQSTVAWGSLLNAGVKLNPNHKIVVKTMFNQNATSTVNNRTGNDYRTLEEVRMTAQRYLSRNLLIGQLSGEHFLPKKNFQGYKATWRIGGSKTDRDEPDFRRLQYTRSFTDSVWYAQIPLKGGDVGAAGSGSRFYSTLTDKLYNGGVDFTAPFKFSVQGDSTHKNKVIEVKIKVGAYFNNKFRDFNARNIVMKQSSKFNTIYDPQNGLVPLSTLPSDQIFAAQNLSGNVNDKDKFFVGDLTRPSDNYSASSFNNGAFIMTDWNYRKLKLNTGVRLENFNQVLNSYKPLQDSYDSTVTINSKVNDILPSCNFTYVLTEKINLRAAYYQTISRPEFRELAPFAFNDFTLNGLVLGNPQLKRTKITNADLRFEYFPTGGELISASVFYKKFTNPIELYGAFSTNPTFTYQNADEAVNYGAEVEFKKSLRKVHTKLQYVYITCNAAYIKSEIRLDTIKNKGKYNVYTYNRALQGQSPYLFNTGIYYTNPENEFSVSLLFNVFGKRIFLVGSEKNPDIYELPRKQLDFQISKVFKKHYEVRLSLRDILNNPYRFMQDANGDNKHEEAKDIMFIKTQQGFTSTFSVGYRF